MSTMLAIVNAIYTVRSESPLCSLNQPMPQLVAASWTSTDRFSAIGDNPQANSASYRNRSLKIGWGKAHTIGQTCLLSKRSTSFFKSNHYCAM